MIAIRNNPNFRNWLQVFSFGKLVDEFTKESDALALASQIAKNTDQPYISVKGEAVKVKI
jgi:hypothetical protein